MVVHNERRKGTWGTPLAIFVMTFIIGIFGWGLTDILTQVRMSVTDLKTDSNDHFEKLWTAFSSVQSKANCLEAQMAKCCPSATYCG